VTRLETKDGIAPAKEIEPMRWEIVGMAIFAQDDPADKDKQKMLFTIDPTKSPKQITMTLPKADGKKMEGIYELKDSKLRVCVGSPGKERPTEFKLDRAGEGGLIDLERIPDETTELKDLTGQWQSVSFERDGELAKGRTILMDIYRDMAWLTDGDHIDKFIVHLEAAKGFIALTPITGSDAVRGKPMLGLFSWKNDELTLILGQPGGDRATEVNRGKDAIVFVMERSTKK
jgi:uncharacterized protein (TIGR03067 family)